jgi:hypothetical protein
VRHRAVKRWTIELAVLSQGEVTEKRIVSRRSIAKRIASTLPNSTIDEEAFSSRFCLLAGLEAELSSLQTGSTRTFNRKLARIPWLEKNAHE